jgi:hypothetical protein
MKTKSFIAAAALICLPSVASAFSLDFTGVALGTTVPPQLVIAVPGYGNVTFDAQVGSNLAIVNYGGIPSLSFEQNETVFITFDGVFVPGPGFDFEGLEVGESFLTQSNSYNVYTATLQGTGNGAGISGISFVPEPSSALLGVLGASLLVLRRRR